MSILSLPSILLRGDLEQRAAGNCSCIAGIPSILGHKNFQNKAEVVFEWGAYKQYVTRSKIASNAVLEVRSRCVPRDDKASTPFQVGWRYQISDFVLFDDLTYYAGSDGSTALADSKS